jgi:excisionase family DNA binding protein
MGKPRRARRAHEWTDNDLNLAKKAIADGRDYMTARQAAAILDCSTKTVYKWVEAGKLKKYRRPGGSRDIRIQTSSVIPLQPRPSDE